MQRYIIHLDAAGRLFATYSSAKRTMTGTCQITFHPKNISPMFQKLTQAAFTLSIVLLAQCGGRCLADEQPKKYVDDKFEFSLTFTGPWKNARLHNFIVPGVVREAYAGPRGASLVVFVQEPDKAFEPRFLVDESAKSIEKSFDATIREKDIRSVAGKKAMWLIVEGNGTGGSIDGKGSVKTTQHWLAFPREKDVIVLLMTSPSGDFKENEKSFGETIKTLTIGGSQTEAQQQAK